MAFRFRPGAVIAVLLSLALFHSCSKGEKQTGKAAADSAAADTTISYISEEVSLGVYFDESGVKRTAKLGRGETQTMIYLIANFPEAMHISAVEYRLVLPKGVTIENDRPYEKRVAILGTLEGGISETFACTAGPKLVLHAFTVNVPSGITNGEIALIADPNGDFLGVALCDEGNTMVPASSYKAVINPTD